jgi:hypothetical protein
MARPKQTYEERGPDDEGTPFERFQRLLKRVVSVSKDDIDDRERQNREQRSADT